MSKNDDFKPGNPEYDFWYDKDLYPSLRDDEEEDFSKPRHPSTPEYHKTGFGTVFLVACVWMMLFAPFGLFFTWEDSIVQFIFWGGLIIIAITYVVAFYNAYQEWKRKRE